MSEQVYVQAIETLHNLDSNLRLFADEAEGVLIASEREIQRNLEWLRDRVAYWRWEAQSRQEGVEAAHDALANCQQSRDDDCSEEEEGLVAARARLEAAEEELLNTHRWLTRVEDGVDRYRAVARTLNLLVTTQTKRACYFLQRRYADLEKYASIGSSATIPAASSGVLGSSPSGIGAEPRISGFDASGAMSNDDVRSYLTHKIPLKHTQKIDGISYSNQCQEDPDGSLILGFTATDKHTLRSETTINRQSHDGSSHREEMEDTIAHEVGHNVWWNLDEPTRLVWGEMSKQSGARGYVSSYAKTGVSEDFCESYSTYINYPALLRAINPDKYLFMKDRVFKGEEYV